MRSGDRRKGSEIRSIIIFRILGPQPCSLANARNILGSVLSPRHPAIMRSLPRFFVLCLFSLASLSFAANADRKAFTTSPTLANEATALIKLLEEQHYNASAVRAVDYAQVVPDYMEDLDSQKLFFLATDQAKFGASYGKNVYYNTAFLGNIDAAYDIYYVYQKRVEDRVAWILAELAKDIDFTAHEAYETDRTKLP